MPNPISPNRAFHGWPYWFLNITSQLSRCQCGLSQTPPRCNSKIHIQCNSEKWRTNFNIVNVLLYIEFVVQCVHQLVDILNMHFLSLYLYFSYQIPPQWKSERHNQYELNKWGTIVKHYKHEHEICCCSGWRSKMHFLNLGRGKHPPQTSPPTNNMQTWHSVTVSSNKNVTLKV